MSRIVVCMDCPNYAKGGFCNHKRKDGLQTICKECHNAKTKESIARRKAQTEDAKPKDTIKELTEAVAGITNGLKAITDQTLVAELRARGWEVTCTRTVIETL